MKKKSKLSNFIGFLGTLLIVAGLTIIGFEYIQRINEEREVAKIKESMMDEIFDLSEENDDKPSSNQFDGKIWSLIQIDEIDVDYPVIVSDDFSVLRQVLVAYKDSTLPPAQGNLSIAGHRGACALCGFSKLKDLSEGSEIKIVEKDQTHIYRIKSDDDVFIVDKSDTSVLDDVDGETTITLITCVTVSKDPRRQIVRAHYVESVPTVLK